MKQASISVYFHRKTGEYIISKQLFQNGLNFDSGPLKKLRREELQREGRRIFAEHLEDFQKRTFDEPSEFISYTGDERAAFQKEHMEVTVYQPIPSQVKFWPSKRWARRGRATGRVAQDQDSVVTLHWPATDEEFFGALLTAFENAE